MPEGAVERSRCTGAIRRATSVAKIASRAGIRVWTTSRNKFSGKCFRVKAGRAGRRRWDSRKKGGVQVHQGAALLGTAASSLLKGEMTTSSRETVLVGGLKDSYSWESLKSHTRTAGGQKQCSRQSRGTKTKKSENT